METAARGQAPAAPASTASTASRDLDELLDVEPVSNSCRPDQPLAEAGMTAKPGHAWPNYLEALELINGAGQAMTALEQHSQRIQSKAFELTQKAKADRQAASQQIASLQQRLAASETRVAELDSRLAEAELRAQTAQEWLRRFLETINDAFARHRFDADPAGGNPGTAA